MGVFNELAGRADMGKTILFSLLVGLPTAVVAGPLFGKIAGHRVTVDIPHLAKPPTAIVPERLPPSFALTVLTILLPVVLMLSATLGDLILPLDHRLRQCGDFVGNPSVAMLVAVLFSFWSFGFSRGFDRVTNDLTTVS